MNLQNSISLLFIYSHFAQSRRNKSIELENMWKYFLNLMQLNECCFEYVLKFWLAITALCFYMNQRRILMPLSMFGSIFLFSTKWHHRWGVFSFVFLNIFLLIWILSAHQTSLFYSFLIKTENQHIHTQKKINIALKSTLQVQVVWPK